jgi:Fic family protein
MLAKAIRGSNSIEGYLVSKEDALAAVDGEEPLDGTSEAWIEVQGYRDAMTLVLQLAKDKQFIFNDGYLRSMHYMMLKHDLTKNPGLFRKGTIFVQDEVKKLTVYEGPGADIVPGLIAELVNYLKGSKDADHLVVKAAMAHLNLVMIHPFSDGNGRMARCLQTLVLAGRGIVEPAFCSIEEYLGYNRQAYYDVLASVGRGTWNPENTTREWIRFNIAAHYIQAKTTLTRMHVMEAVWNQLEARIEMTDLPERVILALADATMGLSIRSTHYRHVAEISNVVASRDLNAMVKAGFLIPKGEKRGRIYTASVDLRAMYMDIRRREHQPISNPFEISEESVTA